MHKIALTDQLYKQAERRAAETGFARVEEYVAEMLSADRHEEKLDYLFTPERITHLDRISAEIKAGGKTYTAEEADAEFDKCRAEWIRKSLR